MVEINYDQLLPNWYNHDDERQRADEHLRGETMIAWLRRIALSWRPVPERRFVMLVEGKDYGYE